MHLTPKDFVAGRARGPLFPLPLRKILEYYRLSPLPVSPFAGVAVQEIVREQRPFQNLFKANFKDFCLKSV
jgi:hypothetical protein